MANMLVVINTAQHLKREFLILTLVMTEGLHPTCLVRKACLSDSSISSLAHSDVIASLNSDDSVTHCFLLFSSCEKRKLI